jgi:glucokinase
MDVVERVSDPAARAEAGELIGVDLGGTKLACGTVNAGMLAEHRVVPSPARSAAELIDAIVATVESQRTERTAAVGIGVPSVVDWQTGHVRATVNLPLHDVPLRDVLRERLGLPVYVDNDAACAALAEAYEGDVLVVRHLVMLTVGTGVGGGIVIDGRPYRGATGAAAELGHTIVDRATRGEAGRDGRPPRPGSLEALASGRALDALAREAAAADPRAPLGRAAAVRTVSGRDVVVAARDGDRAAIAVLRELGERLGLGIANAINTFDPEQVVIGGGVSAAGDLLLEPARRAALHYVLPGVGTRTVIRLARYGADAGVRGAALLAGQELAAERGAMRRDPGQTVAPAREPE